MSADDHGTTLTSASSTARGKGHADLSLPTLASGQTLRVDGTNVVRVPFGVRRPRRTRPARPERWATVVLPFVVGGSTPPPPQAA
jgi:hypothetical protein